MKKKAAVQLTIETLVIIIGAVVILLIALGLIFTMFVGPANELSGFQFNISKLFG